MSPRTKNPPRRPFYELDVGARFRLSRFTETGNLEHLSVPGKTVYVKTGRYGAKTHPDGPRRKCHFNQGTWKT